MKLWSRAAVALLLAVISGSAARADPIPPEWLQHQHDACLQACGITAQEPGHCTALCDCASREIAATMTREEYATMSNAAATRQRIPSELNEKLMTVEDRCQTD